MKNEKVKRYEELRELDSYFKDIKKIKSLSREKECELSYKIQNGDEEALWELVRANLKFVVSVAKKYRHTGVCFSDLISEGNVGLIKAARKFDPTKNVKFISYAVWWIKSSIQDCISDYKKENELTSEDDIFNMQSKLEYGEMFNVINNDFAKDAFRLQNMNDGLKDLTSVLEKRELRILELYFGLYGNKECTLDEIGEEMNLTKERIRQIKDKAIVKMKCNAMMSDEFDTYSELI